MRYSIHMLVSFISNNFICLFLYCSLQKTNPWGQAFGLEKSSGGFSMRCLKISFFCLDPFLSNRQYFCELVRLLLLLLLLWFFLL